MRPRLRLSQLSRWAAAPAGILVVWTFFTILSRVFFTPSNLQNIAGQVAPLVFVALGQMTVLVTGGFDISVGAVAALASVFAAHTINRIGLAGLLSAPAAGLACGTASGVLVGYFRINPIIATLGMLSVARGLALALGGGNQAITLREDALLNWLAYGHVAMIPASLLVAGSVTIIASFLVRHLRLARRIYMVGSNRQAAALVGVPVEATLTCAYAFCGLMAGLAGSFFLARTNAGLSTEGSGLEMEAIAAAVIGGTALAGGVGDPVPVFLGAIFIQTLGNGLDLAGFSPFIKEVTLGSVIVIAGLLDFAIRRIREVQMTMGGSLS